MPAMITHYLAAKRSAALLSQQGMEIDFPTYCWGAQGPDFFFYHKPLSGEKSIRKIGFAMHKTDPEKIFLAFRKYTELCSIKDLPYVYSYCYGLLSHLALDSGAHPFVYYFQEKLGEQSGDPANFMHHKIEHNLDVILLEKLEDRRLSSFKMREALPSCRKGLHAAAGAIAFVTNELYSDYPTSEKEIYKAFCDFRRYEGLLLRHRRLGRKVAGKLEEKKGLGNSISFFIRPESPWDDFDYTNSEKKRWYAAGLAGGRPSSADFFSIFQKGVEDSAYLAGRFKDCAEHRQPLYFLKDFRFNNGSKKLEVRLWIE